MCDSDRERQRTSWSQPGGCLPDRQPAEGDVPRRPCVKCRVQWWSSVDLVFAFDASLCGSFKVCGSPGLEAK